MAGPGVVSFRSPGGRVAPAVEAAYAAWVRAHHADGYVAALPAGKLHRAACPNVAPRGARAHDAGRGRRALTLAEKLCARDPAALRAEARARGLGEPAACRLCRPDRAPDPSALGGADADGGHDGGD